METTNQIMEIAKTIAPDAEIEIIGVRPGEKLHELMIANEDVKCTIEKDDNKFKKKSTFSKFGTYFKNS